MNTLMKMVPEIYYECDWNGARIIVIVQQTKNDLSEKKMTSFATCRFSTLKMISYCLEDIVSHKNTSYQRICAY